MSKPYPFAHKARKRFGQNFLTDQNIINRIVTSINAKPSDRLIEIGPGQGAITQQLIQACPQLQVIELDRDLIPILLAQFAKYPEFAIHQQDALRFDFETLMIGEQPLRIVGNLPYNISLKLLIKWIYSDPWPPFYDQMILMFQKEVAERIVATSNNKKYGRISILTDARLDVKFHFNISKKEFNPEPKVDSSVLSFTPKKNTNFKLKDLNILSDLTKIIFNTKRKMISKTLKKILNEKELKIIDFNNIKNLRPENLDFSFYYKLVDLIKSRIKIKSLSFMRGRTFINKFLIIDEALSTGDAKFKEKSLNRVKELRSDDRALILVSHAMQTVRETCNDVAWLHKGKLIQRGEPNAVIDAYQEFLHLGKSAVIDEDF